MREGRKPTESDEPARSVPRVLVVDDDRLVLLTVARGLRRAGYDAVEAGSAAEALEHVGNSKFDLAIFDVRMPGISGIEAAKKLSTAAGLPFMMFSAFDDPALVKEAVEAGALGYLVKPLDLRQVVPAVEAALKRAAELRRLQESEAGLNSALGRDREISVATGVIMERLGLPRADAFERLRKRARNERRKLADVARDVISGACEP